MQNPEHIKRLCEIFFRKKYACKYVWFVPTNFFSHRFEVFQKWKSDKVSQIDENHVKSVRLIKIFSWICVLLHSIFLTPQMLVIQTPSSAPAKQFPPLRIHDHLQVQNIKLNFPFFDLILIVWQKFSKF